MPSRCSLCKAKARAWVDNEVHTDRCDDTADSCFEVNRHGRQVMTEAMVLQQDSDGENVLALVYCVEESLSTPPACMQSTLR